MVLNLKTVCCCDNGRDDDEESFRQIVPVHLLPDEKTTPRSSHRHPHHEYRANEICTTKYNLITFLPRNLFEQFHRVANIIFLLIGLLNFLPSVNALIPEVALLPLLFVLFVTAVKDAYEDYRRYRSDNEINNLTCRKYSRLVKHILLNHSISSVKLSDFLLTLNSVYYNDILWLCCC